MRPPHFLLLTALPVTRCLPQAPTAPDQQSELAFLPQDPTGSNDIALGAGCARSDGGGDSGTVVGDSDDVEGSSVAPDGLDSRGVEMDADAGSPALMDGGFVAPSLGGDGLSDGTGESDVVALKKGPADTDTCPVREGAPVTGEEEEDQQGKIPERRDIQCSGEYIYALCCYNKYIHHRVDECVKCKLSVPFRPVPFCSSQPVSISGLVSSQLIDFVPLGGRGEKGNGIDPIDVLCWQFRGCVPMWISIGVVNNGS